MITVLSPFVPVAHAVVVTISTSVPGMPANSTSSPGAFIAGIYQFALMIGGVLAFGIIVFGGVKYMTSAGNPSGQGDAKEWIQAALLGLLLLVGAYFILNIVNPQLTNLGLPTLTPPNIQTATPTTAEVIQSAIASCLAACKDASCTAACNSQGASIQAAFSGTCSVATCPSNSLCQNDGNGGHTCLSYNTLPANPLGSPAPSGDYSSCAQANCGASGKQCYPDLSNHGQYTCL